MHMGPAENCSNFIVPCNRSSDSVVLSLKSTEYSQTRTRCLSSCGFTNIQLNPSHLKLEKASCVCPTISQKQIFKFVKNVAVSFSESKCY